jgi:thioredoxin 1
MTTILIIASVLLAFIGYLYLMARKIKKMPEVQPHKKVLNLTASNFKQYTNSGIALVDFWASWCMPCKMMAPVLNELADSVDDKVKICKINIEEQQQLANTFKVKSIPTIVLLRNGKEVDRVVGVKTKDFLLQKIDRLKYI